MRRYRGPGGVRRGFTLVELVVVLLLLGLLASASVPASRAVDGTESGVDAGARELAGLLRRLQRTAVERGQPAMLQVAAATHRYRVETTSDGDDAALLEDSVLYLAPGVTLRPGAATVTSAVLGDTLTLRWLATPRGGITGPAVMVQEGMHARRIAVDAWTAEVRVDDR